MSGPARNTDPFLFLDLLDRSAGFVDRLPLLYLPDHPQDQGPVRESVERSASAEERDRWRDRARRLIDKYGTGVDAWELAYAWSRAGEPSQAIDCATRAAQVALRDRDPAEAALRFALAIDLLSGDPARSLALRRRQADAWMAAGFFDRAARAYDAAARETKNRAARGDLLCLQARARCEAGEFDHARRIASEASALASRAKLSDQRARADVVLGLALGRLGDLPAALETAERARAELVKRSEEPAEIAQADETVGLLKLRLQAPGADDELERAIEAFTGAGRPDRAWRSYAGLTVIAAREASWDSAEQRLRRMRERAGETGRIRVLETTLSRVASLAARQGRLDLALALSRQALQEARRLSDANLQLAAQCRLAEQLRRCGRTESAAALLRESLRDRVQETAPALTDIARMLLAASLLEESPEHAGTAKLLIEQSLPGLRRRRDFTTAVGLLIEMERVAQPGCADPLEPVVREFQVLTEAAPVDPDLSTWAGLVRAKAFLTSGNPEAARDAADTVAREAARTGQPLREADAQALIWQASTQLARGEEAALAAENARATLDRLDRIVRDPDVIRDLRNRSTFRSLDRPASVAPISDPRLTALYGMIRALNSESDPATLLDSILDMAIRAVEAERGMLLLIETGTGSFTVRAARNADDETADDARQFSRNIARRAGEGRPLLVIDALSDSRVKDLKSVSLYGIRSLMCVPLRARGEVIGTVYLDNRRTQALFSERDLRFLEAFADHAALALENVRRRVALERENLRLQATAHTRAHFSGMVGRSPGMQNLFDLIQKFAASDLPVLVQGESGTGKELVARAIHTHSPRRRKIFLSQNCASVPDSLLESELFGHVKGAFTGADRDRAGLFEQADGGTLFLDEVGDMSPTMQAKLLRVLQERELRRLGSSEPPVPIDVRIVAATHRDLQAEVAAGRFREDLYYRLGVLVAPLPPLRERPGDVPLLTGHFLERIARERGTEPCRPDDEVLRLLEQYSWPGNVRQLESLLQRFTLLTGEGPLTLATVRSDAELSRLLPSTSRRGTTLSLAQSERERIEEALRAAGGNRDRAAILLGISRATIYRKIKQHHLA